MGTGRRWRVIAFGSGVKHLKQGDRTLGIIPRRLAERARVDAGGFGPLPGGERQSARDALHTSSTDTSEVPPTAYLMLTDFGYLAVGDPG